MRGSRSGLWRGTALVLALALAAGCTDSPDPSERPSSPASVNIIEPEPGAVYEADEPVTVRIELRDGELTERVVTDITPDEGHMHLHLNGELIDTLAGLEEELSPEPGEYLLEAEFVAMDHAPFNPRVIASTSFTVEE